VKQYKTICGKMIEVRLGILELFFIENLKKMKRFAINLLVVVAMFGGTSFAQETASNDNNVECQKNYSLYSLSLQKKMYEYAITPWRAMFDNCPTTTIRLYSDGIKLYDHYIRKEKDVTRREAMIDTVMLIYDRRIEYYGTHPKYPEGWILGRKGMDLLKYRKGQDGVLQEVYAYFDRSIELMGEESEPAILLNWMQAANALVQENVLTPSDVLDNFFVADRILSHKLSLEAKSDKHYELLKKVDNACFDVLKDSGLEDCQMLEAGVRVKYDGNKEDVENVRKVLSIMDRLDCNDAPLYVEAAEQNYKLEPNAEAAYFLAKMFIKKENMDKAIDYYNEAISQAEEGEFKAKLYYELALVTFSYLRDGPKARALAHKSLQMNSTWGKPYILIGNIYAYESKSFGENDFEQKTVFWAALDKYLTAKRLDPECVDEANKQIELYTKYMPDKETGFFHGFQEGQSYMVGSWINEETTVRYR
jgi:tetratricopeptide (TPR) repeat protein